MTIYHIDKYYDKNDEIRYCITPYNFKGTIDVYLRLFKNIKGLFKFFKESSFSECRLQKKLNKLQEESK